MTTLPFGSEFSPSQIELKELLEICKEYDGSTEKIESEILKKYFSRHKTNNKNRKKLAMNCRLGLKAYGIIDENSNISKLGLSLFDAKDDEELLYSLFAKHILLNLYGMTFIQCIRDMNLSMQKITLETLRKELQVKGVTYPSGGKHPSIMRLWLEKAGIFSSRWNIDEEKLKKVLGNEDDMASIRAFSKQQRYFLLSLINSGVDEFQPASNIAKLSTVAYGIEYPEKSLPKSILNPLKNEGYIEVQKSTAGRGAKSHLCKPTSKAKKEILEPLIKQLESQVDPKLTALLLKSIPEILKKIKSKDRYVSGIALEALAFKILRIVGLDYLSTRLRAEATGGSEVDLIFHTSRLTYSRWQVQCKNTAHVSLDQVAKEVGLTQMLYSNVIVIMTTGNASDDAHKFANHIMKNSNLCIVFIESNDIKKISEDPLNIIDVFDREANNAMQLKKMENKR